MDVVSGNEGDLMFAAGAAADESDLEFGPGHTSIRRSRLGPDAYVKFVQLFRIDNGWGLSHQA